MKRYILKQSEGFKNCITTFFYDFTSSETQYVLYYIKFHRSNILKANYQFLLPLEHAYNFKTR